jgi:hypothetical protein
MYKNTERITSERIPSEHIKYYKILLAKKIEHCSVIGIVQSAKHLIVPKKHSILVFKFSPKIIVRFLFCSAKKNLKNFFLSPTIRCKNFFSDFWKGPIMSLTFFLGMSQHPSTGILKHVLHWGW